MQFTSFVTTYTGSPKIRSANVFEDLSFSTIFTPSAMTSISLSLSFSVIARIEICLGTSSPLDDEGEDEGGTFGVG